MTKYLIQRLLQSLLVIAGLLVVVFFVTHALGDPAQLMIPEDAPEELYLEMRAAMGYDDPILVQFGRFFGRAIIGDFGVSIWQRVPVFDLVLDRLPATLLLAFVTTVMVVIVAIPLGTITALKPSSPLDRVATIFSLAGVCVPPFWLALMLILVVAVQLRLLPTSGYGAPKYLILPILALMWRPVGHIAQITRTSLHDIMSRPYVLVARAKGLGEWRVVYSHALKNAAIPVITLASGALAGLLNGSTIIESIFAWPGLGLLTVDAIRNRDLPLLQGAVVVVATMTVLLNLLVDILYAAVDPRVRFD